MIRFRTLSISLWLAAAPVAGLLAAPTPTPTPVASPTASPASPANTPPTPSPAASPTASPAAVDVAAEVAAQANTADSLWAYIKKWSDLGDLESLDPSLDPEARMNLAKTLVHDKMIRLHPAVDEFLKRYGQDPRHWSAMLLRVSFLREEESISDESVNNTLQQIAHAPDAPADAKQQARGALLQDFLEKSDPAAGLTDALEKELSSYEKDFPDDPAGAQLVSLRVRIVQNTAPDKLNATLALLAKSPNKSTAATAQKQLDIRTKPLDLKLSTLDGKEIDFTKLRGKVVLLDFWATWCAPCMAKVPEITALYKKYKDKDFQLVGVSLDESKPALLETLKEKGMDWPEHFDAKGGEGEIPMYFGVEAIPAAWIVDKKGLAHQVMEPDADLDVEIAKALGEGGGAADAAKKP